MKTNKPTSGPCEAVRTSREAIEINAPKYPVATINHDTRDTEEMNANAHLIASAFNSATSCEAIGYDGGKCVEALPEMVAQLASIYDEYLAVQEQTGLLSSEILRNARALLASLKNPQQ